MRTGIQLLLQKRMNRDHECATNYGTFTWNNPKWLAKKPGFKLTQQNVHDLLLSEKYNHWIERDICPHFCKNKQALQNAQACADEHGKVPEEDTRCPRWLPLEREGNYTVSQLTGYDEPHCTILK